MNTSAREAIRANLLAARRSLDLAAQRDAAEAVSSPVAEALQQRVTREVKVVAGYLAHEGEISPEPALKTLLDDGWSVVLPVCGRGGAMEFCPWVPGDRLAKNRYGIAEPQTPPATLSSISAVIVPGVAFDRTGNRLGHGVGFYDRFFERCAQQSHHPYRLGLAYDFQIVELPAPEPWDIPVQSVVSPSEVIDTTPCE